MAQDPRTLLGTTLDGRYTLEALVSHAPHRLTFHARHSLLNQPVHIKILPAADLALQQRFVREAQLMSRLRHPHIAEVRDFGRLPDGRGYLVMEPLLGPDLSALLAQGAFPQGTACALAAQIARGLHAAHLLGVVHRGLHPGSVALVQPGPPPQVKLADFALAYVPDSLLTAEGIPLPPGTPEYLSPEQARGLKPDARSDQYALGCVLHHLLLGAPPFTADKPAQILIHHCHTPLSLPPGLPPPRAAALGRMLHKDPAARFPSLDDIATFLQERAGSGPRRLCYLAAPRDRALRDRLDLHLRPLRDAGSLLVWHDDLTPPGSDPHAALAAQLAQADLVAVLLSPDLLASQAAAHLPALRARAHAGQLLLFPVLLRPTAYEQTALHGLLPLPRDGRPVTGHKDRDVPLQQVAQEIAAAVSGRGRSGG